MKAEGYSALHEFWNNLRAIPNHVYRAMFRGGAPKTDRTRSSFIFGNVFLHLHSVRTHLWSLRWSATMGLGIITTAALKSTFIVKEGEKEPPPIKQTFQNVVPEKLRMEWGDYVWWDAKTNTPKALTRDEVGKNSKITEALLEGSIEVTLADGSKVKCRTVFDLIKEYAAHFDPKTVEEITWAPAVAWSILPARTSASARASLPSRPLPARM